MVMERSLLRVRGIPNPAGVSAALNQCRFCSPSTFILRLLEGWNPSLFTADTQHLGSACHTAGRTSCFPCSRGHQVAAQPSCWLAFLAPGSSIPETPQSRRPLAGFLSPEVSLRRPSRS